MSYFKYVLVLVSVLSLFACSDDDPVEINEDTATMIYNDIKGTYEGNVRVGNETHPVRIIIANDEFTIKQLPLQPILQRVFTDQGQLEEVMKSVGETTTFTAPVSNLSVMSNSSVLTMEPSDLVLTVTEGNQHKQLSVLIQAYASWARSWGDLTVEMYAIELYYDGKKYDLTYNRIEYFIDNAKKPKE